MGNETARFNVGHMYNLHNGHQYFMAVAISAQYLTLQKVPPANWGEETIRFFES